MKVALLRVGIDSGSGNSTRWVEPEYTEQAAAFMRSLE